MSSVFKLTLGTKTGVENRLEGPYTIRAKQALVIFNKTLAWAIATSSGNFFGTKKLNQQILGHPTKIFKFKNRRSIHFSCLFSCYRAFPFVRVSPKAGAWWVYRAWQLQPAYHRLSYEGEKERDPVEEQAKV